MRIGYSLWGMPQVPVEESLPFLAQTGYQGVELAVTPGWNTELYSLTAEYKRTISRLLEENHLILSAVAGHTSMVELDEDKNSTNLQRLRDSIDLAAEMVQVGQPAIMASLVGGRPDDWEPRRELLAERVRGLGDYAAERNVILALEPHCGTAMDMPDKVTWILDQVNHPNVKLNFDISHMDVMGVSIDDSVPLLAPYSVHTHVKDQRGIWPKHEFLTPGEGPFDFVHYMEAMKAAGYQGFIVAEVSVKVQRRPDYDPLAHAALAYRTLENAFRATGVPIDA